MALRGHRGCNMPCWPRKRQSPQKHTCFCPLRRSARGENRSCPRKAAAFVKQPVSFVRRAVGFVRRAVSFVRRAVSFVRRPSEVRPTASEVRQTRESASPIPATGMAAGCAARIARRSFGVRAEKRRFFRSRGIARNPPMKIENRKRFRRVADQRQQHT
jgi:hypothetical protein